MGKIIFVNLQLQYTTNLVVKKQSISLQKDIFFVFLVYIKILLYLCGLIICYNTILIFKISNLMKRFCIFVCAICIAATSFADLSYNLNGKLSNDGQRVAKSTKLQTFNFKDATFKSVEIDAEISFEKFSAESVIFLWAELLALAAFLFVDILAFL